MTDVRTTGAGRLVTDLTGSVAVVTGATDGIGRGVAEALGRSGASVVVASRREEAVTGTVADLRDRGIAAFGQPADVRDERNVEELVEFALSLEGSLDILVNCAGGSFGNGFKRGPLLDASADDLMEAYRLNVIGAFLCATAAARGMGEEGGSIVNVSSMGGVRAGSRGMAAYGASKAALNSLTKSMAIEWAPRVRVNAVAPGYIDTPRTTATRSPERLSEQLRTVAMGRMGTPAEVGDLVLYLASPAASWTTGVVYEIDGGFRT